MPRTPKFSVTETSRGYCVACPASLSASGKRERRYFKSRDDARDHAKTLRKQAIAHGSSAKSIRPALAEDAVAAAALLEPFGVSLLQAAREYTARHDKRQGLPTLRVAWDDAVKHREGLRERSKKNLTQWGRRLPVWIMDMNCFDITPDHIKKAINSVSSFASSRETCLRHVSLVFGDLVKEGRLEKNPVQFIKKSRAREKMIVIFTPDELQRLFDACRLYDDGFFRDCTDCAVPFAVLAFAGIRPDELTRLRWDDVCLDRGIIKLDATKTKTLQRRIVRIHPTLRAWLEQIPSGSRHGKIVPAAWVKKAQRVRKEAGIDGKEKQDALRHSFGSYLLAFEEGDIHAVGSDMGHKSLDVFLKHYHEAVTKAEAIAYFAVLPPGVEAAPLIKAVPTRRQA